MNQGKVYKLIMKHKYSNLFIGLVGIGTVFYWLYGAVSLDPDFGWHIRMGQLILSSGIPATDPFSYTMPSYPFVDHEWLTNIFLAWFMPIVGHAGLAGVFVLFAIGAILLQWYAIAKQQRQFGLIPFFLAFAILVGFFGIRPQVISWFFFSLLLFIILDRDRFRRWRFWLPWGFLLWANLHGGFPAGIVALFIACAYRCLKGSYSAGIVFLLCMTATFITPYGWRMWWEVWMQMTDSSLRWTIAEWRSIVFVLYFSIWIFFVLSAFLVIRYRKKFTILEKLLYFAFLAEAFSSVRHVPLWVLVSLPMTTAGLSFLYKEAARIEYGAIRFMKSLIVFFVIICFFSIADFISISVSIVGENYYPQRAISYLRQHSPKGQVFSSYNWGGYLIWKLPERQVFIDGRMPSWRWKAPKGESDYAFEEQTKISVDEASFNSVTSKYGISTILLPVEKEDKQKTMMDQFADYLDLVGKSFGLEIPKGKELKLSKAYENARRAGWVIVYKDDKAVIYQDKSYGEYQ